MLPPTFATSAGDRVPTDHVCVRGQSSTGTGADISTVLLDVPRETHFVLLTVSLRFVITAGASAVRINRARLAIVSGNERAWLWDVEDSGSGVSFDGASTATVSASTSRTFGVSPIVRYALVPGGHRLQAYCNLSDAPSSQQILWSVTGFRVPAGTILIA